jgi:hypothetical protein
MEENDTSLILEEGVLETKLRVKVQAYSCRVCGFIELWKV